MTYQINQALGHFVIVEPFEKSTVLQADETATIFKIISIGAECKVIGALGTDDLILVKRGSVNKMPMGGIDVWYIYDCDVVAKLKDSEAISTISSWKSYTGTAT